MKFLKDAFWWVVRADTFLCLVLAGVLCGIGGICFGVGELLGKTLLGGVVYFAINFLGGALMVLAALTTYIAGQKFLDEIKR